MQPSIALPRTMVPITNSPTICMITTSSQIFCLGMTAIDAHALPGPLWIFLWRPRFTPSLPQNQSLSWIHHGREVYCCIVELVDHRVATPSVHRRSQCHIQSRVHRHRCRLRLPGRRILRFPTRLELAV